MILSRSGLRTTTDSGVVNIPPSIYALANNITHDISFGSSSKIKSN